MSGEGQLRAPSAAAARKTAAFAASATADVAAGKAYRNMTPIIAYRTAQVEWFSGGPLAPVSRGA
jgi:hypothetical protein